MSADTSRVHRSIFKKTTRDNMAREHRFMSAERVEGYTDAVYAIVITILIVPIAGDVADYDMDKTLFENLYDELSVFLIYILAFIFIYSIWEDHVWIFSAIEHVADTVSLANIVLLLPITFLPYSVTLLSEFIEDAFAIFMLTSCVIVASCLEILITCVAFSRPKMLKEEVRGHEARIYLRGMMVLKSSVKIVLAGFATGLAFASPYASWAFLILLVFHDAIAAVCIGIYNYYKGFSVGLYRHRHCGKYLWHHLFEMKLDKDRVAVFSDGVFSIVATLIILDLSTDAVPSVDAETSKSLRETLAENQHMFLSYLASFVTVGLLWINHQAVVHHVSVVTRLMSALNKASLLFLGLLPFCFKLVAEYAGDSTDRNENYVVQINSACMFFASICQLLLYAAACRHSDKHFHDSHKGLSKIHVICKLLIIPIISLIGFCVCFMPNTVDADVISICTTCVILLYAILKLVMEIVHNVKPDCGTADEGDEDVDMNATEINGIENKSAGTVEEKSCDNDVSELSIDSGTKL
ncbi:endosomal/lysosomal proton channel TMEM175-like isoform X1 [Ptychodera flava]|uniref:endosomal/lysosomal proton channel TMEM175-like isoform X1 n=1 Tax=Ptychodera flava TaxID=63121 RepID=UPI003969CF9A